MSHFKLLNETSVLDTFPVRKYVSRRTGLNVVIADVEGVNICGNFTIVTEPEDNYGHGHALEHLIFNGSEKYPFNDVLKSFNENTNAWSEVDHTNFYFSVSSQNVALALLPIYFDHILRPLLSEDGFVHYVHHVNGNGEDGGLMYEEMNIPGEYKMCINKLNKEMYPGSGYSYDHVGNVDCLINYTSIEEIREFHKKFYRPDNMVLLLTGIIDSEALFNTLSNVEDDYMQKRLSDPWENFTKPWQSTPLPPNYGEHTVEWSNQLEINSYVIIGWRGPVLTDSTAVKELRCCEYILEHLCHPDISLLHKDLVKTDLAKIVSINIEELKFSQIRIEIFDVPIIRLDIAKEEILKCLGDIREGIEDIDIDKVKQYVTEDFRNHKRSLETNTHSEISELTAKDFLLSEKNDDFDYRMKLEVFNDLLEEPKEYWLNTFRKYFNHNYVLVIGKDSDSVPSGEEIDKKRIEERKANLDEEELAEKAALVNKALDFVQKPVPQEILDLIPLPSAESIAFQHVESWTSDSAPCSHFDTKDLPIFARVQSLTTNFVHIHLILDTCTLHHDTRKWLPLLLKCLGECPIRTNGHTTSCEEVKSNLNKYSERWRCQLGFGGEDVGTFGNFVNIEMQCFPEDYIKAVGLLHDILYNTEITEKRIESIIADELEKYTILCNINQSEYLSEIINNSLYSENSNMFWCNRHRFISFLKQLKEELQTNSEEVIKVAQMAYNSITERVWLNLATDFTKYRLSTEPWKKFTKGDCLHPVQTPHLYWDAELISHWGGGSVTGVEKVEAAYFTLKSPGPLGHSVNEEAALLVALQYFKKKWLSTICKISYNQHLTASLNEGCITLSLFDVTEPVEAYSIVKTQLNEYLSGSTTDTALFKAAKEHVIYYDILTKESYPVDVVRNSLLKYLQRTGEHYTKDLVKVVSDLTPENARVAAARWLPSLFDSKNTKIAILTDPEEVPDIKTDFQKLGINLEEKSCDAERG